MAPRRIDPRALPPESPLARVLAARPRAAAPVRFTHDGEEVEAREGEPLALALAAAGRLSLVRSAKYHRPRGPACMRGHCDGCLVRVDGVPDVMACQVDAKNNMTVVSQNAFPTAGLDLLRVTDWFFPSHMDHHHLMTGFGAAVNRTMLAIARRMSGLGTLPDAAATLPPPERITVDALVVGAGAAGTAAANALARAGLSVACADEEGTPGGAALDALDGPVSVDALSPRARFFARTSAAATFDNGTLLVGHGTLTHVTARARVFATGCAEVIGTFSQNDAPGVFTARAFARALARGVLLGERVVVVGGAAPAAALVRAATDAGAAVTWARDGAVREADGGRAVRSVTVATTDGKTAKHKCDALVIAEEPVAAYELAGQAGATLAWEEARRCFVPASDDEGATSAPGVYVAGSVRRAPGERAARRDDGARVGARVARDLRGG